MHIMDHNPLFAVLVYGLGIVFVLAHVFVNAMMLKDPKAINRFTAKRGIKTILSGDDVSWRGTALAMANLIGGTIMYGAVITVLMQRPLQYFDVYVADYMPYVFGALVNFLLLGFVTNQSRKAEHD